jgi:magnesium chelatase family protein
MKIYSFLSQGTEIQAIEVQVHLRFQIPSFQILGLAGPEIQEARERIIAAFNSSEIDFPKKKLIVNLAPSDVKKKGTGHDLAMALGILAKKEEYSSLFEEGKNYYAWGSLGLDGCVGAAGKMASLLELICADLDPKVLFLTKEDAISFKELENWRKEHQLNIPKKMELKVIHSLRDVLEEKNLSPAIPIKHKEVSTPDLLPLQPQQERLLDISIIGRHHTLILGPKGVGKSQLLKWYQWLSPECDPHKTWKRFLYEDSSKISSSLPGVFPMRSVHAQVKPSHLLGSWNTHGFKAGELSLAHGGILVADEFLEWHRDAKECLREPLQNKKTTITRVQGTTEIECDFQLIATGNLCPCGGLPSQFQKMNNTTPCKCHPRKVLEYLDKISGPIADRIDMISIFHQECISLPDVFTQKITEDAIQKKKQFLLERQQFAIQIFGSIPSELSVRWLENNLPNDPDFENILKAKTNSLRARHKALRLARTIQALEEEESLKIEHLFEALSFKEL